MLSLSIFAQKETKEILIGYWEGAFIKNNAYQKFEIDVYESNGKLIGLQVMDEWHPSFGEFEVPIQIDSLGAITFGTGYGKAKLDLDKNNLELIGSLESFSPSVYIHLKKAARKPSPNYTIEEVFIKNGEQPLFGHLHKPIINSKNSAIILVGGRGCGADLTYYNLYAKVLRAYGIAVLAYHKRGTGKSKGDCNAATINNLASDVIALKDHLKSKYQFEKIGVLGISAGGWVMTKAEEKTDFDFMISVVGPSTSVKEQQLQSASYGADFYKLNPTAKANVLDYTKLMFEAKSQKDFEKMKSLLKIAKEEDWFKLLEDTDLVKTKEDINKLWVRRHNYDPKEVLKRYTKPFLGIYGERDWIVPAKENIDALKLYFKENSDNLTTVLAHNAEHGMEMEQKEITLKPNVSYWHFYRISPQMRIALIDFLTQHNFIK